MCEPLRVYQKAASITIYCPIIADEPLYEYEIGLNCQQIETRGPKVAIIQGDKTHIFFNLPYHLIIKTNPNG